MPLPDEFAPEAPRIVLYSRNGHSQISFSQISADFMPQEQSGVKRIQGIGVVAAFGLLTMSSSIANSSLTTMSDGANYCYEAHKYINNDNTVCSSSTLSRQAVGDIVLIEKKTDFVQQHEKINVNLQITKITKHINCPVPILKDFNSIKENIKAEQDYYIINFKDIFSVPVDVAKSIAEKTARD